MRRRVLWLLLPLAFAVGLRAEQALHGWKDYRYAGVTTARQGYFDKSLEALERAKAMAYQELGDSHPALIPLLLDLATAQRRLAKSEDAESSARWALALARRHLADDDDLKRRCLRDLANVLRESGKSDEARLLYHRALKLAADNESSGIYADLARLERKENNAEKALEAYRQALRGIEGEAGENLRLEAADWLLEQKRYALAEEWFEAVKQARQARLDPNAIEQAPALEGLARVHLAKGSREKALPLLQRSKAIRERSPMTNTWAAFPNLEGATRVYLLLDEIDLAAKTMRRCIGVAQKTLGEKHPLTLKLQAELQTINRH